jgi:hypothetical protein
MDHAGGTEFIFGIGHATHCQLFARHSPQPLRYVWHHILPQACGGLTKTSNLASLCDSCHYAVHALLYDLRKHDGKLVSFPRFENTPRGRLARQGYEQAKTLGTVDKIPAEGSVTG